MPTSLRPPTQLAERRRQKEAELPSAMVARESFLSLQVCRRNSLTDDAALDLVGRSNGTRGGWVVMTEADLLEQPASVQETMRLHVPCNNYPDLRTHFVAIC